MAGAEGAGKGLGILYLVVKISTLFVGIHLHRYLPK